MQCSLGKVLKGLSLVSIEAETAYLDLANLQKIFGLEKIVANVKIEDICLPFYCYLFYDPAQLT